MSRREDSLSRELYITLACLTGIIGIVLLALAVFPDVDLAMRVLRVVTALALLEACRRATRVARDRLRAPRMPPLSKLDPGRLHEHVLRLMRDGRKIGAVRLYRDATGVGLLEAKRAVERIAREDARERGKR